MQKNANFTYENKDVPKIKERIHKDAENYGKLLVKLINIFKISGLDLDTSQLHTVLMLVISTIPAQRNRY